MAIFDNQGDVTVIVVRSDPFSNSSEILCISLLCASFMQIQQKNEKKTTQAFFH